MKKYIEFITENNRYNFKVGDKVKIPMTKSVEPYLGHPERSSAVINAKRKDQDFLYIGTVGINTCEVLTDLDGILESEFAFEDLIPYEYEINQYEDWDGVNENNIKFINEEWDLNDLEEGEPLYCIKNYYVGGLGEFERGVEYDISDVDYEDDNYVNIKGVTLYFDYDTEVYLSIEDLIKHFSPDYPDENNSEEDETDQYEDWDDIIV